MAEPRSIVEDAVKKHGTSRESLLPILQDIVKEKNYITDEEMSKVAELLDISSADVYGTASFYSFLDMEKRGTYVIRVCKTITCYMKGKDGIIKALEDRLKIKLGETTSDGKFSLLSANCMGWCHEGPVMLINDKVYTKLTPKKAVEIINEYY